MTHPVNSGSDRDNIVRGLEDLVSGSEMKQMPADGHLKSPHVSQTAVNAGGDTAERTVTSTETHGGQFPSIKGYSIQKEIGEGGMGVVYEAQQLEPIRRSVAVKIVRTNSGSGQVLARFETERQALALMEHPGIAKFLAAGLTTDQRPFFSMELVRGVPVTEFADQESLSIPQRLELVIEICRAVQHAHHKGIVHRDLKPSNILAMRLDGRNQIKVIDFGLAKALDEPLTAAPAITGFQQILGTITYMSPEQASGNPLEIDTRTDVYSLGIMLYQLLAGALPLEPEWIRKQPVDEVLRTIRRERFPAPSLTLKRRKSESVEICNNRQQRLQTLIFLLQSGLDLIVGKAIEKDPSQRYATPLALAEDLERFLKNELISVRTATLWYRLVQTWRRNRLALAFAGSSVLLCLAGAGVVLGLTLSHNRELSRVNREITEQRDEIKRQSLSAISVQRFVQTDLLGTGDIKSGVARLTPETPYSTVLTVAAQRVRERLGSDPEAMIGMQRAIAFALQDLHKYEEALSIIDDALATSHMINGEVNATTGSLLDARFEVLMSLGRIPEAIESMQQALQVAESLNLTAAGLADIRNRLGLAHLENGNAAVATELLEGSLRELEELFGSNDERTLKAFINCLALWSQKGVTDEQVARTREFLKATEEGIGAEDERTCIIRHNLGFILADRKDVREAIVLHRKNAEIRTRLFGPDDRATLSSRHELAYVLGKSGQYAAAVSEEQEVLRLHSEKYSELSPEAIAALHQLAELYTSWFQQSGDQEHLASAIQCYRDELQRRSTAGIDNPAQTSDIRRRIEELESKVK